MDFPDSYASLSITVAFSVVSFFLTYLMIPPCIEMNLKKNIKGVDINKIEDPSNKDDPDRKEV